MANSPPVLVVQPPVKFRVQQNYSLATFITAYDPDGFVASYVFKDLGPGGWLTYNGTKIDGTDLVVNALDLSRVGYYTGSSATGSGQPDLIFVAAVDNLGATSGAAMYIYAVANQAPTMSGPSTWSIPTYSGFSFSTYFFDGTFNAQDSDGSVVSYRFTDPTPGAGYLALDGAKISGTSVTVSSAELYRVEYLSDRVNGSNDITIEAIDDLGLASNSLTLAVTVTNQPPQISGPSAPVFATTYQDIYFTDLVSSSDADGHAFTYFITNDSGTDYFTYRGVRQPNSFEQYVLYPTDLIYHTGEAGGTNTFTVRVRDDDFDFSQWLTVSVNVTNRPPDLTGPVNLNKGLSQIFQLGSLISASDRDGTVSQYRFKDATPGNAYLTLSGVKVEPNSATGALLIVSAADLGKVGYYTGTLPGSNVIDIEAIDNQGLASAVLKMTIQTAANNPPTISGPARLDRGINQSFVFTPHITATDADGEVAQYRFTDSVSGAGNLTLNGERIAGTSVTVGAADLGKVGYHTGANAGSNFIAIESIDNSGAASRDALMMTIYVSATPISTPEPPLANQAPTISGPTSVSRNINENFSFGTTSATGVVVLGSADVDGTVAKYRFTDNTPGAGYLTVNGGITGSSVTVTAADLGTVGYNMGPTEGSASIAIWSIDNLGMASATALTMVMTMPTPVTNGAPNQSPRITGPGYVNISYDDSFTFGTTSGPNVLVLEASDLDGAVEEYRFTQQTPESPEHGYLTKNGSRVEESSITVSAAELGTIGYYGYSTTFQSSANNELKIEVIDDDKAISAPLAIWVDVSRDSKVPMLSGPLELPALINTSLTFESLISASDKNGTVTSYQIEYRQLSGQDSYLTLRGEKVPDSNGTQTVRVQSADLGDVAFFTGSKVGVRPYVVFDARRSEGEPGEMAITFVVAATLPGNQAPVLTGPTAVYKSLDQDFTFTSLISASDVDSAIHSYEIADLTAGLGYLTFDSERIASTSVIVSAADMDKVGYYTGTLAGSNSIQIEAIDTEGGRSNALQMAIVTGANNAPTITGSTSVSIGAGQTFGFTSGAAVISASDSDGQVAQYQFTDSTTGAGYLRLNGEAAPSVFTVAAQNLGQVAYYAGANAGSNAIAIKAIDNFGTSSPTLTMTVNVALNDAPTISGPTTVNRGINESFTFGTASAAGVVVLGASDAGATVAQYRFWDTVPGAGYLTFDGAQIQDTSVTVAAADLGKVGYSTGASVGTNSIVIEVIDLLGLANPSVLTMTINVSGTADTSNRPPTISGPASVDKAINESFTFSSLISASDADGTVEQYRFSDIMPGAGYLTWNGNDGPIPVSSILVSAADLDRVVYNTGPSAGANSIVIEAIDNLGMASPSFLTMAINVAGAGGSANQAPIITGPTAISKGVNEYFGFSATDGDGAVLLRANDPDGTVAHYRFSDSMAGAGYLKFGGKEAPSVFTVPAANLGQVTYYTGLTAGSNSIAVEAIDNLGRASPTVLTMTINVAGTEGTGGTGGGTGVTPNQAPTVVGPSSMSWSTNQTFSSVFSSMLIAGDADGTVAQYRFTDSHAGAGHLTLSGQPAPDVFTVAASNLWQVGYSTGLTAGSNVIAIEAIDNLGLASPSVMTLTINVADAGGTGGTGGTGNLAPTIIGPASVDKGVNESFNFTSLLSASDADGTIAQYRFSDSMSGAGYLTLNGARIAGTSVTVSAANLGQVGYSTDAFAGSNSIAIEAIDNLGRASSNVLLMTIKVSATSGTGSDLQFAGSDIALYLGRAFEYTVGVTTTGYDVTLGNGAFPASTLQNLQRVLFDDAAYYGGGTSAAVHSGGRIVDGGRGIDTLAFHGSSSQYTISHTPTGFTIYNAIQGSLWVTNVERLMFTDGMVALDIDGDAGIAYRLYQAAFNRTPDLGGLGYQMTALDNGLHVTQVASNFIASPEFQSKYGTLTNEQFVRQLYANVLHREAEVDGYAYHLNNLNNGYTRADVLVGFSESPENKAAVIGVIQDGMHYTL